MRRRNNYAVSELLGVVYILMISTTLISAIYVWAPQQLEEQKTRVRMESAVNQFEMIDNVLQDMIRQGAGSSKSVNFVTDKGYVHVGSSGTRLVIFYPLKSGVFTSIYDFDFHVAGLGFDTDDQSFMYIQKTLPSWWDELDEDDKKITLDISYINEGTSEVQPSESISYPKVPCLIYFTDKSSDYGGTIESWEWDFNGDGTPDSTDQNPIHEYIVPDVYTVTLTVTDNDGDSSSMEHDVVVFDTSAPHAAFSYSPMNPTTADEIQFTDESTGGSSIDSWKWDFDYDGSFDENSIDQDPKHTYSTADTYTVRLILNKDDTDESNQEHTIEVRNAPPTAVFTYTPNSPISKGADIDFTDASVDGDGTISLREWDFDYDGNFNVDSTEQSPQDHVYTEPRVHTVMLKVTDNDGGLNFTRHDIVVVEEDEPVIEKNPVGLGDATPVDGDDGYLMGWDAVNSLPYLFKDNFDDDWEYDLGTSEDTGIILDPVGLGDATPQNGDNGGISALDTASKLYIFEDSDDNGEYTADTSTPHAAFSYTPTNPKTGENVGFTCESTYPNDVIETRNWGTGAGIGEAGNSPTFTHKYADDGTYTATLGIGYDGGVDSISHDVIVTNVLPTAEFSYGPALEWDVVVEDSSLSDAVKIDVKVNKIVSDDPYTTEEIVVGRIWLFDLGFIKYEVSSSQTTREMIFENEAIISSMSSHAYLANEPAVYNKAKATGAEEEVENLADFIMRIIQFKSDEKTIGSGSCTYRFNMKLSSSCVRENAPIDFDKQDIFKMQIFGDYTTAWTNFFKSNHNFENVDFDDDTICYNPAEGSYLMNSFMLIHSIVDIDLGVMG